MTTKRKQNKAGGRRWTQVAPGKFEEVTERRAVMLATLRVDLYGLISSSLAPLAKGSMVMVTGGDYTTEFLEVTVPGTQRRICVMHHEVWWEEMVGDSVLREQLERNLAYFAACAEHPQHKQELMRRRARIVRDMHGQYATPCFQLAIYHEGRVS